MATAWADDSARVEHLKDNHKRLPKSLYEEVKILDSVLNDICEKKKIEPPVRCEHVRSKLSNIRSQLNRIGNDIHIAKGKLDSIGYALSNLRLAKSTIEYDTYRNLYLNPRIKEYEQLFEKIRRGEKRLVRRAIWYAAKNYWSKDPFPTTAVSQYLLQVRKEEERQSKVEIEAVKKDIGLVESEKIELEMRVKHLGEQIKTLQSTKEELIDSTSALYSSVDFLKGKQMKSAINLDSLRNELARKKEDLNEKNNDLEKLKASRDSTVQQLSQIEEMLGTQARKNKSLIDTNDRLSGLVLAKQDSLLMMSKNLSDANKNLFATKDRNTQIVMLLSIGLVFFLLLALYSQYQRVLNARRGKENLRTANAKLAMSNGQLNTLISELHHRTKNNLQEISSLLYLQARGNDDESLKNALNEARGRIDAIGIVHRLLYQDKQQKLTTVNLARYVEELAEHLFKTHHLSKESIRTVFNLQDIYIEADKATQVGLITNELIHNCFKHAFPKTDCPELAIGLNAEDGAMHLTVKDNGPGLSHETDWKETNSFGLKLVRRLVEGRRGIFCYEEKNGAVFNVTLPLNAGEYEIAT